MKKPGALQHFDAPVKCLLGIDPFLQVSCKQNTHKEDFYMTKKIFLRFCLISASVLLFCGHNHGGCHAPNMQVGDALIP